MDKKYCVYLHTFPNGKVYVGTTCRKPKYRWNNGNGYANRQRKMYNAIQKYGWQNVKHEILYDNLTKKEAAQKEIELIALYNSTNDKYGYNIEKGGNLNKEITEETRQLMIKNHKGMLGKKRTKKECEFIGKMQKERWRNLTVEQRAKEIKRLKDICVGRKVWNKGLHFSEEAKRNMSIAKKIKYEKGYVNPRKGKELTQEHKKKLSISHIGKIMPIESRIKMKLNNANSKKIIVLETKQVFNSGKECAEALGCHRSNPNNVCNGKVKTCKGYHLMWLNDYNKRNSQASNILCDEIFG